MRLTGLEVAVRAALEARLLRRGQGRARLGHALGVALLVHFLQNISRGGGDGNGRVVSTGGAYTRRPAATKPAAEDAVAPAEGTARARPARWASSLTLMSSWALATAADSEQGEEGVSNRRVPTGAVLSRRPGTRRWPSSSRERADLPSCCLTSSMTCCLRTAVSAGAAAGLPKREDMTEGEGWVVIELEKGKWASRRRLFWGQRAVSTVSETVDQLDIAH